MKQKVITDAEERTHVLILETGDEVVAVLQDFCREQKLSAARFTAIGAFRRATLAYFDWESKQYEHIPVDEQVEVLVLAGDVALKEDGAPKIHAHVVVGKRDGSAHGGHLVEAHVRPTLEVMLVEAPGRLRRRIDPESGLALIDAGA